MADKPHATGAIVSIGDELAIGQSLDTNAKWLASRLTDLGVRVVEHATVADDLERHVAALRRLTEGADGVDLVVSTGGLGPTADDLTRAALARLLDEPQVEDAAAVAALRRWFAGRAMPERNLVQAQRPASAACLANPNGTAPGLQVRAGGADVFCLPGPPREMQPMFEAEVAPRVRRAAGVEVATRVIPTFGLGESDVAARLGDLMDRDREGRGLPLVGTTASQGVVSVRIRHVGRGDAAGVVDALAAECRALVGEEYVLGEGVESLAACVLDLLRGRGEMVAVAESCTGGGLGASLTETAGSSDAFAGGFITYTNGLKMRLLGVPEAVLAEHGAVSRACAEAMAEGALRATGAAHALSITGIAGPGGGSEAKPVGTVWIGLASAGMATAARRFRLAGDRANVRAWSAQAALGMLRLRLIGREELGLLREVESAQ